MLQRLQNPKQIKKLRSGSRTQTLALIHPLPTHTKMFKFKLVALKYQGTPGRRGKLTHCEPSCGCGCTYTFRFGSLVIFTKLGQNETNDKNNEPRSDTRTKYIVESPWISCGQQSEAMSTPGLLSLGLWFDGQKLFVIGLSVPRPSWGLLLDIATCTSI